MNEAGKSNALRARNILVLILLAAALFAIGVVIGKRLGAEDDASPPEITVPA